MSNTENNQSLLTVDIKNETAVIQLDDGKANAFSFTMIEKVTQTLDELEANDEIKAIVIAGRPGRLSGGFDLKVMSQGGEPTIDLVCDGAKLMAKVFSYPKPVVVAATGHALALGAILLFTGDYRIGIEGDFKIGLNEVAIGMTMPLFGQDLGAARLSNAYINRAVLNAEIFGPEEAQAAGFLDQVCAPDQLLTQALEKATELAALNPRAFANTKKRLRGAVIEKILGELREDVSGAFK